MLLLGCSIRFGPSLRYIELPIELITHTVLHELSNKCPNLTHMLLDFSTAMQLHDFSEMQVRIPMRPSHQFSLINILTNFPFFTVTVILISGVPYQA